MNLVWRFVFWDVTPCRPLNVYRRFERSYYPPFHGQAIHLFLDFLMDVHLPLECLTLFTGQHATTRQNTWIYMNTVLRNSNFAILLRVCVCVCVCVILNEKWHAGGGDSYTQTQKDSGKLLTCVFFQQFVNTRLDVECPVLEHKIPALKLFEPMHFTLITTAYYIEQDGISATLHTSIQEVLG